MKSKIKRILSLSLLCNLSVASGSMLSEADLSSPDRFLSTSTLDTSYDSEDCVSSNKVKNLKNKKGKKSSKLKYAFGIATPILLLLLGYRVYKSYKSTVDPEVENNFKNYLDGNVKIAQDCKDIIYVLNNYLLNNNFDTSGFDLNKSNDLYKLITEFLKSKGYVQIDEKDKKAVAEGIVGKGHCCEVYSKKFGDGFQTFRIQKVKAISVAGYFGKDKGNDCPENLKDNFVLHIGFSIRADKNNQGEKVNEYENIGINCLILNNINCINVYKIDAIKGVDVLFNKGININTNNSTKGHFFS